MWNLMIFFCKQVRSTVVRFNLCASNRDRFPRCARACRHNGARADDARTFPTHARADAASETRVWTYTYDKSDCACESTYEWSSLWGSVTQCVYSALRPSPPGKYPQFRVPFSNDSVSLMLQELFCGMLLSIIDFLIVFKYVDLYILWIIHIALT